MSGEPMNPEFSSWFAANGFVRSTDDPSEAWEIAWSDRLGYDFTDLKFRPTGTGQYGTMVDAILGHHASGTNPRMRIGTCTTLDDVKAITFAVQRLNGYKTAEDALAWGPRP